MLYDVVHFKLPESYLPVSSRRSPQLTNGHGHGGKWEQRRVDGMGLGDEFVTFMDKAWLIQDLRERKSMSPRRAPYILKILNSNLSLQGYTTQARFEI